MPYVKREYREILNDDIDSLLTKLKHIKSEDLEGCLNYVITLLVDRFYGHGGYSEHNKAIGVLECVKSEFWDRRVRPREDTKCVENGDVFIPSELVPDHWIE